MTSISTSSGWTLRLPPNWLETAWESRAWKRCRSGGKTSSFQVGKPVFLRKSLTRWLMPMMVASLALVKVSCWFGFRVDESVWSMAVKS